MGYWKKLGRLVNLISTLASLVFFLPFPNRMIHPLNEGYRRKLLPPDILLQICLPSHGLGEFHHKPILQQFTSRNVKSGQNPLHFSGSFLQGTDHFWWSIAGLSSSAPWRGYGSQGKTKLRGRGKYRVSSVDGAQQRCCLTAVVTWW